MIIIGELVNASRKAIGAAIEAALEVYHGTPLINSISLEKDRYDNLMPIIVETDFKVIALCMRDGAMPETVEDRMKIVDKLVNGLLKNNVNEKRM